ncbi:hypothetical protein K437DRAFT_173818 [Tilletiaria anomala UBC 951]|uniref:Uncharacterized protein n=1 Tax=Tilletiaria anomala (strain ATCC 24038 / CBS 436.72 / UBC 951) TaxID=1037660 RepID=A0A066WFM7_TILAU|nr:uncharacterized protein K437DRAFT_173818 [Tilletiaria anomala UBC 951]KDN52606.1 hypothetical protein K437DRAFT_173818 [Tilletiaria anomala UBC 951]
MGGTHPAASPTSLARALLLLAASTEYPARVGSPPLYRVLHTQRGEVRASRSHACLGYRRIATYLRARPCHPSSNALL